MDGILVLLLIGWILKAAKKKKDKAVKHSSNYAQARQKYQQYKEQMFGAAQKRQQEKVQPHEMHEADCHFSSEGRGVDQQRFSGSMQVESTEGEDLCAEDLGHRREDPLGSQSVYANEIGGTPLLDFGSKSLLQGVVMSEILTRPAERYRRR